MADDILYEIRREDGSSMGMAHGMQIGRFAVRCVGWSPVFVDGEEGQEELFVVDHIATGLRLIPPTSFREAVVIADDVSRFSERDPAAGNPPYLLAQLGTVVMQWLMDVQERITDGRPIWSFREFGVQMGWVLNHGETNAGWS